MSCKSLLERKGCALGVAAIGVPAGATMSDRHVIGDIIITLLVGGMIWLFVSSVS